MILAATVERGERKRTTAEVSKAAAVIVLIDRIIHFLFSERRKQAGQSSDSCDSCNGIPNISFGICVALLIARFHLARLPPIRAVGFAMKSFDGLLIAHGVSSLRQHRLGLRDPSRPRSLRRCV
jgi:hypothetical protein